MEGSSYYYAPREGKLEVIDKNKLIDILIKTYASLLNNYPPSFWINIKNNYTYDDIVNNEKLAPYIHKNDKIPKFYYCNVNTGEDKLIIVFDKTLDEVKKILNINPDGTPIKCSCSGCNNILKKGDKVFVNEKGNMFCSQECVKATGSSEYETVTITKTQKEWQETLRKFMKIVKDNPDVFDKICKNNDVEQLPLEFNSKLNILNVSVRLKI